MESLRNKAFDSAFVDSIARLTYKAVMRLVALPLGLVALNSASLLRSNAICTAAPEWIGLLQVRRFLARNASVKPEEIKFLIDLARDNFNVSRAGQECRKAYFKSPKVRHKLKIFEWLR
jgi:hypothetical protein